LFALLAVSPAAVAVAVKVAVTVAVTEAPGFVKLPAIIFSSCLRKAWMSTPEKCLLLMADWALREWDETGREGTERTTH
jgi:hypothetical protein